MIKVAFKDLECGLISLYGEDKTIRHYQNNRYNQLLDDYYKNFANDEKMVIISTPGRTEISGNHTDHNGGKVIAASINLDTLICVSKAQNVVKLKSNKYEKIFEVDLSNLDPKPEEEGSTNSLIRGIAAGFVKYGFNIGGFQGVLTSDVNQGSGLSSSASIEVAIGATFNFLYNENKIAPDIIAKIGQYAENKYFGKPCGLMDQIACAVGGVVSIDFKDNENPIIEKIDFSLSEYNYKLLVVDTGGTHQNLTEDYASIPFEMKAVAKFFGKDLCSEIKLPSLLEHWNELRNILSDRAVLRAYHFLKENERVGLQVKAMKEKDLDKFLSLVKRSGDSSFKYVQNIYSNNHISEQPISMALAATEDYLDKINGGASRVHGGGFAGTIQVFLPQKHTTDYTARMEKLFGRKSVSYLDLRPYGSFTVYDSDNKIRV